ncbi:cell surface glycoprotein [Paenibacillus sp. SYP-B3998]|uniref:Cell surface glycoprotein n=1 Tax=Paenibacillus sp. SYP-B3998 TaxID=2678564 RepID=A0A6G4A1Y2_9BACL|nr:S-layer homology domain-containing protein [Paenibacillus sp. SYP-B3998]NEW08340.1 cell surface glycoprotein [Paenibacillus sp. SYP-B3998]
MKKRKILAFTFIITLLAPSVILPNHAHAALPGAKHQKVGDDVFLGGNYIEMGISKSGSFGSKSAAPANFHPAGGRPNIGFSVDGDGFDNGDPMTSGDFFLPGSPFEGFFVGSRTGSETGVVTKFFNSERTGSIQIPSITNEDLSSGDTLSVKTTGITQNGKIKVEQTISFGVNDKYFKLAVKLTNLSAETLYDVRYMRIVDPDIDADFKGTYATLNSVPKNPPSDAQAIVIAKGPVTGNPFILMSADSRARAAINANDPYSNAAYQADGSKLKSAEVTDDQNVGITGALGNLAPNASATFDIFESLDPDLKKALDSLNNATPTNHPPTVTDNTYKTTIGTSVSGAVYGSDADGDALTFSLVTSPAKGSVDLAANGAFTYKPKPDALGQDSFTYKANDGKADSVSAAVYLTITRVEAETPTSSRSSGSYGETITVNVENSGTNSGVVVASAVINRTMKSDGTKKDQVDFSAEQAKKMVDNIIAAGSTSASIVIPDAKDEVSEVHVTVPKEAKKIVSDAKIELGIATENAKIKIPSDSLQSLADELYFRFFPIKDETKKKEVNDRANNEAIVKVAAGDKKATAVGRPMTIETNLQNRNVTLVMPLKGVALSQAEMKDLAVYIEHSDGTKQLLKGVLVPYNNKGDMGLQFSVNKFSTFTLMHVPGLTTKNQHTAYMNGYEDGTFKPENKITRAEMAALLARVVTRDTKSANLAYSDVSSTHWAKDAIAKATAMGLMQGYADGTFKEERSITRAEMASIVSSLTGNEQRTGTGFTDIAGHWAQAYIVKAQGAGIINGYQDGSFQPEKTLTRAEAVTMINKALGRGPLSGFVQSPWKDVAETHWALRDIEEASVDHAFENKTDGGEQWVQKP